MIDKIEYIRNFGIFSDFAWDSSALDVFKAKNIIYGWNYSGKTTLSRIFSSLKNRNLHPDYGRGAFRIKSSPSEIESHDLSSCPLVLEVFNSDYIKENLRWEQDQNISAIAFEVGENAKLSNEINDLQKTIESINGTDKLIGQKQPLLDTVNEFKIFEESLFSAEAKRIKNEIFLSLINFDKGHFRKYIPTSSDGIALQIIKSSQDLNVIGKTILMTEPKAKLQFIKFSNHFSHIINLVSEILESTPKRDNIIKSLEQDNRAYEWVKEGMPLHASERKCIFCSNEIPEARYQQLVRYFQNQASELRQKAKIALDNISQEIESCNSSNLPYSENDFNDNYQEEFRKFKIKYEKTLTQYKTLLQKLKVVIDKKIEHSLYEALSFKFDKGIEISIDESIKSINDLIEKNNSFIDNFTHIVETAREKYKAHLVATFIKEQKYFLKAKESGKAEKQLSSLDAQVAACQNAINILQQRKESTSEGCVQLNAFVQSFLGRNDIEIKPNRDGKYNLLRGGESARNLSEGERMAISFAHFLVLIKSLGQKGYLKDYIVFIDDPISSLDNNHIFQVNSLLKEVFFEKVNDAWKVKCKQLFISTHNYDFFNLLKELPKPKNQESRYFIARGGKGAIIEKLPKSYDSYKSEYHFLFNEIYAFNNDPLKSSSPKLYFMPNILRRFLEMYTLTKYPSAEEVDERANVVFDSLTSKRILKPLHYHSHFNSIDRIGKHSELLADISVACGAMLQHIQTNDELHYNALVKSLS